MSKTKVVLASVLKPVDDSRTYEKIGYSLNQTKKYDINIIGFRAKNIGYVIPDIKTFPIFQFSRLSLKRILAPIKCLIYYVKLKPDVIIFNTHELIIVSCLYRMLFQAKLCYDVRENYYRNIKYGSGFHPWVRAALAGYVRAKEYISHRWINHYFIAEINYENEFSFTQKKGTVIQNKFHNLHKIPIAISASKCKLIFSGTLAETTGVFEAINLAKSLHKIEPKITLKIVGRAAQKKVLQRLINETKNSPWITLVGGEYLVPHSEVITEISEADIGLIHYPKNQSTERTIPTKLYEYLALQLPILLGTNQLWQDLCSPYQASINIDYENFNASKVWSDINEHTFYSKTPKSEVEWASEAKKLLNQLDRL